MSTKTDKKHVSDEDHFLASVREKFAECPSQELERTKHEAIAKKRDHAQPLEQSQIWEDF